MMNQKSFEKKKNAVAFLEMPSRGTEMFGMQLSRYIDGNVKIRTYAPARHNPNFRKYGMYAVWDRETQLKIITFLQRHLNPDPNYLPVMGIDIQTEVGSMYGFRFRATDYGVKIQTFAPDWENPDRRHYGFYATYPMEYVRSLLEFLETIPSV